MAILQLLNVNYLNSDYNHTIDFADADAQEDYFDALVNTTIDLPTIDDYVYIRENKRIRVGIGKADLDGINYLRFNNGSKWWYAFITSKEYVNENCTDLIIEIDVFQTFMFDYTIKESFITRQHEDRWNGNNPIFNIKQEDIDLGNSYIKTSDDLIIDSGNNDYKVKCALIVCKKAIDGTTIFNKTGSFGPAKASADPLFYYLLPIVNYPEEWIYNSDESKRFMSVRQLVYDMSRTDQDEADAGASFKLQKQAYANIVSISILPYMPVDYTFSINNSHKIINVPSLTTAPLYLYNDTEVLIYQIDSTIARTQLATINFKTKLNIPAPVNTLATPKSQAQETKLYTAPYTYITLDDNQSNPLRIEPQFIDNLSTNIKINQTLSDTPIIMYYIDGYKGDSGNDDVLVNNNVNNLTIAVDKLSDYLNEKRASATAGLATNIIVDTATNVVRTGIGLAMGNPFAISNAISGASSTIGNVLNEMRHRDDLRLGPVNVKDRGNNTYSYLQKYGTNTGLHIKKYDIASAFKQVAYELFYHYGYACRDFLVPNLKSRYYFNYIQAPDMCLDTAIDNEYITKLKSIFANGITIWHYRDANTWQGVENYQYENIEMSQLN